MYFSDLEKHLKTQRLKPVYVIYGNNALEVREAVDAMRARTARDGDPALAVVEFTRDARRLARTLTEQFGVQVVCQGDNAWTDGRRIVLPSVPAPLDEALERCLIGYLDHEMGHVAFSDFQAAEAFTRRYQFW